MKRTAFNDALEEAKLFFNKSFLTREFVSNRRKTRGLVRIRWFMMAYMRARDPNHYSYPVIASAFKLKDHTTAIYGVRKAHENWGKTLFTRLAAVAVVESPERNEQPMHTSVGAEELLMIGENNLARFMNGTGWEAAA